MEEKFIFRTNVEKEFTVIRNALLADKTLSWSARGLLAYLLSKPDTWTVRHTDLIKMSPSGDYKVRQILKELEHAGYIRREKFRDKKGLWACNTYVYDVPQTVQQSSVVDFPQRSTHSGKPHDIVKTELKKTDQTNNGIKKIYIQKIGKLTPSKIKRFQSWETLYSDKWILEAIDLAVQYNKKSFGYIQAILENWKENGRNGTKLTPENVDYLEDEFAEFIEE